MVAARQIRAALVVEGLRTAPHKASAVRLALLNHVQDVTSALVHAASATVLVSTKAPPGPPDPAATIRLVVSCLSAVDSTGQNAFNLEKVSPSALHPVVLLTLAVEGMMCQKNCGGTVTGALLGALPSLRDDGSCPPSGCILHALVSFDAGSAKAWVLLPPEAEAATSGSSSVAETEAKRARLAALLVEAVEDCGFGAELTDCSAGLPSKEAHKAAMQTAAIGLAAPTPAALAEQYADLDFFEDSDAAAATTTDIDTNTDTNKAVAALPLPRAGAGTGAVLTAAAAAADAGAEEEEEEEEEEADSLLELAVTGMSCAACVKAVDRALASPAMRSMGMRGAHVGLLIEKAEVSFKAGLGLTPEAIAEAIEELGYGARVLQLKALGGGGAEAKASRVAVFSLLAGYGDSGPDPAARADMKRVLCAAGATGVHIDVTTHRLLVRLPLLLLDAGRGRAGTKGSGAQEGAVAKLRGPRDALELVRSRGYPCDYLGGLDSQQAAPVGEGAVAINVSSNSDANEGDAGGVLEALARKTRSDPRFQYQPPGVARAALEVQESPDLKMWRRLVVAALLLGVPVVALHTASVYWPWAKEALHAPVESVCSGGVTHGQLLQLLLNTPLQFGVGYRFYRGAILGARHGNYGMDCLVVTGTTITFAYSFCELLRGCSQGVPATHVFLEASGMLLLFVTMGKFMEAYSRGSTMAAVSRLLALQPVVANLVREWDAEEEVTEEIVGTLAVQQISTELLQHGDVVRVDAGKPVPTDGVVVMGSSYVDESMITGESSPVSKTVNRKGGSGPGDDGGGDVVFGSTRNVSSDLYVRITAMADQSALAQIVQLVEAAQMSQAPVQALADRIAGRFTPVVLTLAMATFCGWLLLCWAGVVPQEWYAAETGGDQLLFSLLFAISVVVISCPCALGLATPTAIMVGTTVAAESGMLIKGGKAFEDAHAVSTVVFDKTGTLTEGRPSVREVVPMVEDANYAARTYSDTHNSRKAAEAAAHRNRNSADDSIPSSAFTGFTPELLLLLAATAEQSTTHPLGRAVLKANEAQARKGAELPLLLVVDDAEAFKEEPGRGVTCQLPPAQQREFLQLLQSATSGALIAAAEADDPLVRRQEIKREVVASGAPAAAGSNVGVIRVGNRALLDDGHIPLTPLVDERMLQMEQSGCTAVAVAYGSRVLGLLAVADPLKAHARATVTYLREQLGMDVWMCTGDSATTAAAIASQLGLPDNRVRAGAMPRSKVRLVQQLRAGTATDLDGGGSSDGGDVQMTPMSMSTGSSSNNVAALEGGVGEGAPHRVCMVGDGINDSPALAAADVGMAMGAGAQVALDAADCILVSDDVRGVVTCLALARVVFRRVQLNFAWALVYNVIAIPFAAGLWYPWTHTLVAPQYAGLSMALSSVSVVCSSMALRWFQKPDVGSASEHAALRPATTKAHSTPQSRIKELGSGLRSIITPGSSGRSESTYNPLALDEDLHMEAYGTEVV